MSHACPTCRSDLKAGARFCARCGEPLLRGASPALSAIGSAGRPAAPQVKRTSNSDHVAPKSGAPAKTGFAWLWMCVALPLTICIGAPLFLQISSSSYANSAKQLQIRFADAEKRRADALYDLLKPADVNVVVGRTPDGVKLEGKTDEIRSISQLIDMIRTNSLSAGHSSPKVDRTIRRTYQLREGRAADLARVLSFTPSHVRFTLDQGTLIVTATPDDHRAIESVVRLLGGRTGN